MPKNIVIIDDDKVDMPTADDLISSETASFERVMPSPDMLSTPKKPNILRSGSRANVVQAPIVPGTKGATGGGVAGVQRIVTVSAAPDGSQQSQTAIIASPSGPRSDDSVGLGMTKNLLFQVTVQIFNRKY